MKFIPLLGKELNMQIDWVSGSMFLNFCVIFKWLKPDADVLIQQRVGPFHSSVNFCLKLLMEVEDKTYRSSIQIWTPQSLWLISSQIHEFRRSLSILWTRRLWKTNLWIQSEASRSDSTGLMDVPQRIAASLGSWKLGWSLRRGHKRSIYDAIWLPVHRPRGGKAVVCIH